MRNKKETSGLRNEKKGARRKEEEGTFFFVSFNFGVSCSELFGPSSEERVFCKVPFKDRVLIENAEGIFGEKGECFAGKTQLERSF